MRRPILAALAAGVFSLAAPAPADATLTVTPPQALEAQGSSAYIMPVAWHYWRGVRYPYYWRGGYYNYFWQGRYFRHRRWWHGGWRYY